MSGEELYRMYAEITLNNGIGMDEWDDLDSLEQIIWDQFADNIRDRLNV